MLGFRHLAAYLFVYHIYLQCVFSFHESAGQIFGLKNIKLRIDATVNRSGDWINLPISSETNEIELPEATDNPKSLYQIDLIKALSVLPTCPWMLSDCPSDHILIEFQIKPIESNGTSISIFSLPLTFDTIDPYGWLLQFYIQPKNILNVGWTKLVDDKWEISEADRITLEPNEWNTIRVALKIQTSEVLFYSDQLSARSRTDVKLLRRTKRDLESVARVLPIQPTKRIESITFDREAYIRFNFVNRLKQNAPNEKLTIDFEVPSSTLDGLLWFTENNSTRSYVYLKNSRLYYTYVLIDHTHRAQLTLTEEIYLNTPLVPNMKHVLTLTRNNDNLTLTLNERSHASKTIDGRVPLIPSDGKVYLGGSSNPKLETDGRVTKTFEGRITKAEFDRDGDKKYDLVQIVTDPHWQDSVKKEGYVRLEMKEPKLVISPTASKPFRATYSGGSGAIAQALTREAVPITFWGTQSSVVRFDTWDFTVYRSFEMEFMTYEPNGILFFVGPDREHTDFVCVELFDGNVYFVYAVGSHYRHIQLNPPDVKVNTGTSNRVYVSRNEQHQFLIKFNDRVVDVDQGTVAHQAEFATYTYIGSVDQPSRLPWHVWSRENFAGCISSIRVNDDQFLDPSSRMSQHTDVSRGIQFGVCRAPDIRCNREICGGGQCAERSYPFFEPLNFACDCSGSDKTYRDGVSDIRRSEPCFRDAPMLQMDGEMVLLIDFEKQLNTLKTHTDDISLQFRTSQSNTPLFYVVSPAEKSFFRVDLVGGRLRIQTNINQMSNRHKTEEYILNDVFCSDNTWHTLRIRRRAEYLEFLVKGFTEVGKIPLQDQLNTFQLVAQQIYLGSAGPENYQRPPPPGSETKFLPPPPRFIGEFRNFFWNEYDFIGTGSLQSKYTTDMLVPRAVLPKFPQWPREPTYAITLTARLQYGRLEKVIDLLEGGDMFLIEFKTQYEGVLLSARQAGGLDGVQLTFVLLRGQLFLVYNVNGRDGVYQVQSGPSANHLDDGHWHRIVFGLDRRKKQMQIFLDSFPVETVGSSMYFDKVTQLNFYFGGLPDTEWQSVIDIIKKYRPTALHSSETEHGKLPAYTGCLGGFSLRTDNFGSDLLRRYDSQLVSYPAEQIVRGFCRDQKRCSLNYCRHGGRCEQVSDREVRCVCTGTGYEGPRCENTILHCPIDYCHGHGSCQMINGHPKCDCSSGFYGERCESDPCSRGDYCQNRGVCHMRGGQAYCDCRTTGYYGNRCETPVCSPGYCFNRGRCRVDANDKPVCDCQGTGFGGERCDQTVCRPDTCAHNGRCTVNLYGQPECDCSGTGFHGPRCQQPICTPDYCHGGGRCLVSSDNRPYCDCTGTGFLGDRCQQAICTPDHCHGGGRCSVGSDNRPYCDCTGTGFGGDRCQTPICSPMFCHNGGVCSLHGDQPRCDCTSTGHKGQHCEIPICPPDYCMHGGHCRVNSQNNPECDCSRTNYRGSQCEMPICSEAYCAGRGLCVVRQRQPTCDCHSGFRGDRCEFEVCPNNYCVNGGFCTPGPDRKPRCTCPANYEGDRCELSKVCPSNYCFHGGRCTMDRGVPICDCLGTDYSGSRCEIPQTCPVGFCQNGGRCSVSQGNYVCDCQGTGFRGVICNEPIACPPNYCLYGGICSVLPGNQYLCDCSRTARTGKHCEGSSDGIHIGYEKDGYLVYPLVPPVRTVEDNVTLGFKTYMQSGSLITFITTDGRYWAIKLHGGRVMVEVDGKNVYAFRMRSNDGLYHVLNVERKGDTMIVTQDNEVIRVHLPDLVNPIDRSLYYNFLHIAANEHKSDIFRGVIGGVYWNGRYPITELKDHKITHTGHVTIVLTPEFPIHPPKPQPVCIPGYCLNGGLCYAENYQLKCDCSNTGWNGLQCERQSRGYIPHKLGNGAYIIYTISPATRTNKDEMRVAFQTWNKEGSIARVMQADGNYFDFVLLDDKVYMSFGGRQYIPISSPMHEFADGRMHVITLNRDGMNFNITVDGHRSVHESNIVHIDGTLISREVILGADREFKHTFNGVIGAFYWNGQYLINERGGFSTDANVMKVPGRHTPGDMDQVVVVLMPHLFHPSTTPRPGPPKPLPDGLPDGAIAGGVVMPGLGLGDANLGAPIFAGEAGHGGGGAGMNAGTGLMLKQAGGLLGMGALVDALLAGFLLFLLLLLSALIWACWRCKPGLCACCTGKSGRGGSPTWDKMVAMCCAPPNKSKETFDPLLPKIDAADIIPTYIPPTRPQSPVHLEQPSVVTDQNIYNPDGLKVDSVLITNDNKYFVTGSAMGPPKVWDAHTGDIFNVMEGNERGCTDLHMACNDTVCLGQVVDEWDHMADSSTVRINRLQIWDFATGAPLEMPYDVRCTATCLARRTNYVIVSRASVNGPTILVWNLTSNQFEHEIFYEPMGMLPLNAITYLNISHDDRLVVAGCQNGDQACYMVFDLAAAYPKPPQMPIQPRIIQFDAEVMATEILDKESAVTGTRRGELFVWNLHTLEMTHSIQIQAMLELSDMTVLPPHTGTIHCVQLSQDGRFLATGAQDRLVRIWSMPEGRLLHTLEGHKDDVLSVSISKDSELIVSGSWDGGIRLWRIQEGKQLVWFSSNIEIFQVKLSNDKSAIVALGDRYNLRKLITLRVVRQRMQTTYNLPLDSSPRNPPHLSPSSLHPDLSPNSQMMAP